MANFPTIRVALHCTDKTLLTRQVFWSLTPAAPRLSGHTSSVLVPPAPLSLDKIMPAAQVRLSKPCFANTLSGRWSSVSSMAAMISLRRLP